jgi:5-methylcytosine-specific restriction endonuclease McrA
MCARCNLQLSEIVDHIVPALVAIQQARDSGKFPFDKYAGYFLLSNLQGLCRECHYRKTLEDKTHVGPWPDVVAIETAAPKKRWTF